MALPIKMLATMLGINAREFAIGWAEGQARYKAATRKNYDELPMVIQGSHYRPGTVAFSASQASVAFSVGMEK